MCLIFKGLLLILKERFLIKLFSIFFLVLMGSGLLYAERPTTLYLGSFRGGRMRLRIMLVRKRSFLF